ncbi:GNAT family N-acetyltransferase [Ruicaihuangia caeni]|uniref:GNAT family N-acetyltransferase n=1 Tax=Ruicaihuangia caeni TaxID=3042517 RepID=UPI00338EAC88
MAGFTIEELSIPRRLDDEHGPAFIEMTAVRNAVEADIVGNDDLNYSPEDLLPHWHDPYSPMRALIARVDGRIVARGVFEWQAEDEHVGFFDIGVLPEFRDRGIGLALHEGIVRFARQQQVTTLQAFALHRLNAGGAKIVPPTGHGAVWSKDDGVRFFRGLGYRLEQVTRISRLALPVDDTTFRELEQRALEAAGDEYRIVRWQGRTPDRWIDDFAHLRQRMSVDAPSAGIEFAEEQWNAARIRDADDRAAESTRTMLTVAAEHVPSGRLAGFTELSAPVAIDRAVDQGDTLVVREHRGHALGMLLKLANLRHLEEVKPGHPSVVTFNAEENRYMLRVNEAVGFVPVGIEGAWRKRLDDASS